MKWSTMIIEGFNMIENLFKLFMINVELEKGVQEAYRF